jgi:formylglycine-generating enzyme required for sulfatase activity
MGSPAGGKDQLEPYDNERPAHPVLLDGFEIATTETTWGQLTALRPRSVDNRDHQAANLPAAYVDWNDARAACQAITPDGDLPTEAQWEYAARGGAQTPYPFPSELDGLCRYANGAGAESEWSWKNAKCSDPFKRAAPVRSFPPNPLGLYDMHGNLWEWVSDCYDEKVYSSRGSKANIMPKEDENGCGRRVLRGGSFDFVPRNLRSADRDSFTPEGRNVSIGFRCVRGSGRQQNH